MAEKTVGKTVLRKAPNPTGKGGFTAGNGGGPGRGNRAPKRGMGIAFADMRAAYETDEVKGEKPGIAAARKMLHSDYKAFMQMYVKLSETEAGGAAAAAETVVLGSVGPKEVDVEQLAEELLREWELEDGRDRGADSAGGADAARSVSELHEGA